MKLQFKHQDFQVTAVNAVADLFLGQEWKRSTFSVASERQQQMERNEFGVGNALRLTDGEITANMQQVQRQNKLPLTELDEGVPSFCIEMETGTGKTFVYTKTMYELHKRYGFSKFIIVVPSVAIREGVHASLTATRDYLGNQYDNVPCRHFIYNSSKLSDVRQFANSDNIEIMIINIDAFKKSENIINQSQDRLGGETAMRYIRDTNPVVIVDEPQSVDNTPKAKEAIASLNPLCVLRYSATHREKFNLLYRLTPVDAYQNGLVKQIVVSSNHVENDFNKPYINLLSVSQDGGFKAKMEIDVRNKKGEVSRKTVTVKPTDDLFRASGNRELYDGYQVEGIDCTAGQEKVEFANTEVVALGHPLGSIDELLLKRGQIRRTIEAHLDKELSYTEKGIKVLSLFFIDEVKKYRGSDGEEGVYWKIFNECYAQLMELPKYAPLKALFPAAPEDVHNGYFSKDKKGAYKNTKGDTQADYDTYTTIMKDKELLLSFANPLRFIWSHSALKEGWDNPNVFQVCTLIEQKSTFTCRQKIGRGLRLCVNQDGQRIEDKHINVLHVMANESFAEFADTLQRELETDTGIKFGLLELSMFQGLIYEETQVQEKTLERSEATQVVRYLLNKGYITEAGQPTELAKTAPTMADLPKDLEPVKTYIEEVVSKAEPVQEDSLIGQTVSQTVTVEKVVTYEEAAELIEHFQQKNYITKTGKVKDTMKEALQNGTLDLPKKYEAARKRVEGIITNANRTVPLRDASREVTVHLKKQVFISPEFRELWDKIKQKTAYRVTIDTEKLVENCIKELMDMPPIPKAKLVTSSAKINIETAGVTHRDNAIQTDVLESTYDYLPHILNIISEEALLKRATVRRILIESGRTADFLHNPQAFLEKALDIIRRNRHALAIDGIRYVKLDGQEYFAMEIFESAELAANLDRNAIQVRHSLYDHVVYDSSTVERPFAVALDNDPDVKLFFKIPSRFKIETPIGTYNPDWAVYMDKDGTEKLYFVVETKGSTSLWDLRTPEQLKIHCGKAHFHALNNGLSMEFAKDWSALKTGRF